jgi:hypothetical protein
MEPRCGLCYSKKERICEKIKSFAPLPDLDPFMQLRAYASFFVTRYEWNSSTYVDVCQFDKGDYYVVGRFRYDLFSQHDHPPEHEFRVLDSLDGSYDANSKIIEYCCLHVPQCVQFIPTTVTPKIHYPSFPMKPRELPPRASSPYDHLTAQCRDHYLQKLASRLRITNYGDVVVVYPESVDEDGKVTRFGYSLFFYSVLAAKQAASQNNWNGAFILFVGDEESFNNCALADEIICSKTELLLDIDIPSESFYG